MLLTDTGNSSLCNPSIPTIRSICMSMKLVKIEVKSASSGDTIVARLVNTTGDLLRVSGERGQYIQGEANSINGAIGSLLLNHLNVDILGLDKDFIQEIKNLSPEVVGIKFSASFSTTWNLNSLITTISSDINENWVD